jgi:hypothetical protein
MSAEYPHGDYWDNKHRAEFVLWSGVSEMGKSTHAYAFAKKNLRRARFNFFFDPDGLWADALGGHLCFSLDEAARAITTGFCFYSPSREFVNKRIGYLKFTEWFKRFCGMFRGVKALWADEIQGFGIPKHEIAYQNHPQQWIMDESRKFGGRFYGITPMFQNLGTLFRGQFKQIYAFANPHPDNAKYFCDLGVPEEEYLKLQRGEFIYIEVITRQWKKGKVQLLS